MIDTLGHQTCLTADCSIPSYCPRLIEVLGLLGIYVNYHLKQLWYTARFSWVVWVFFMSPGVNAFPCCTRQLGVVPSVFTEALQATEAPAALAPQHSWAELVMLSLSCLLSALRCPKKIKLQREELAAVSWSMSVYELSSPSPQKSLQVSDVVFWVNLVEADSSVHSSFRSGFSIHRVLFWQQDEKNQSL